MSECNHVEVRKLSSFFSWIPPEEDRDVKCFNKTVVDNCHKCKGIIKESYDTTNKQDDRT